MVPIITCLSHSTGWRSQRLRYCLGVLSLLTVLLCFFGWFAFERRAFQEEVRATAILRIDYHASVMTPIYNISAESGIGGDLHWDLRQLARCRLYIPVDAISMHSATIDKRSWDQLSCFRHLKSLTFQDCRVEDAAEMCFRNLGHLRTLTLWRTRLTIDHLRRIATLYNLENLTLDASGLNGRAIAP